MAENNENKLSENPFFSFAKPYFDFIGRGKVYTIVYLVMAALNLMLPLVVIFMVIDSGFLRNSGIRMMAAFMLSWLVIAFAGWIGFQLWWHRRINVKRMANQEFIAIPIASDLMQTFGEWAGTLLCITGAGIGIITSIFIWNDLWVRISFDTTVNIGPIMIIGGPISGFIIMVLFRLFAEFMRIWTSIANNIRDIARKTKG